MKVIFKKAKTIITTNGITILKSSNLKPIFIIYKQETIMYISIKLNKKIIFCTDPKKLDKLN